MVLLPLFKLFIWDGAAANAAATSLASTGVISTNNKGNLSAVAKYATSRNAIRETLRKPSFLRRWESGTCELPGLPPSRA